MAIRMLDHKKAKIQAKQEVFGKPNMLIANNPKFISSDTVEQAAMLDEILEIPNPEIFYNPATEKLKEEVHMSRWFLPQKAN
jgi:hypothetical protein